jgi:hypothetical protein
LLSGTKASAELRTSPRHGVRHQMLLLCVGREMPEQTIIAWDLETILDLPAAARMLDLGLATEVDVREALGSGFPKHPLHKSVCIGALVASRQPEGWSIRSRLEVSKAPSNRLLRACSF